MFRFTAEGLDALENAGAVPGTSEAALQAQALSELGARGSFIYELKGVVVHSGSAFAGHYYSFIKERPVMAEGGRVVDGKWLRFDDSVVSDWSLDQLDNDCYGGTYLSGESILDKSNSAFMLYYERKDSPCFENPCLSLNPTAAPSDPLTPYGMPKEVYRNVVEADLNDRFLANLFSGLDYIQFAVGLVKDKRLLEDAGEESRTRKVRKRMESLSAVSLESSDQPGPSTEPGPLSANTTQRSEDKTHAALQVLRLGIQLLSSVVCPNGIFNVQELQDLLNLLIGLMKAGEAAGGVAVLETLCSISDSLECCLRSWHSESEGSCIIPVLIEAACEQLASYRSQLAAAQPPNPTLPAWVRQAADAERILFDTINRLVYDGRRIVHRAIGSLHPVFAAISAMIESSSPIFQQKEISSCFLAALMHLHVLCQDSNKKRPGEKTQRFYARDIHSCIVLIRQCLERFTPVQPAAPDAKFIASGMTAALSEVAQLAISSRIVRLAGKVAFEGRNKRPVVQRIPFSFDSLSHAQFSLPFSFFELIFHWCKYDDYGSIFMAGLQQAARNNLPMVSDASFLVAAFTWNHPEASVEFLKFVMDQIFELDADMPSVEDNKGMIAAELRALAFSDAIVDLLLNQKDTLHDSRISYFLCDSRTNKGLLGVYGLVPDGDDIESDMAFTSAWYIATRLAMMSHVAAQVFRNFLLRCNQNQKQQVVQRLSQLHADVYSKKMRDVIHAIYIFYLNITNSQNQGPAAQGS